MCQYCVLWGWKFSAAMTCFGLYDYKKNDKNFKLSKNLIRREMNFPKFQFLNWGLFGFVD